MTRQQYKSRKGSTRMKPPNEDDDEEEKNGEGGVDPPYAEAVIHNKHVGS